MGDTSVSKGVRTSYGLLAFFTTLLHNVFLLYHVETFVSIYKIDKMSFWFGETVFLVWNSLNDPLFGWASDKRYLTSAETGSSVVLRRLNALRYSCPLLAVSFMAFWIPWLNPTAQFVICLCLYDSFLTMIDLHHSALLADLSVSAQVRASLNAHSSFFSALGSLSVLFSYMLWDRDNMRTFQLYCGSLTIIAIIGYFFATKMLEKSFLKYQTKMDSSYEIPSQQDAPWNYVDDKKAMKTFLKQLSGHQNFLWFSGMNLVQVFHCHFNSNFFPLFLETLLGDAVSPSFSSLLLGVSFIAPHINNLYFLTLCQKYGVYRVIQFLFSIKFALAVFMYMIGPNHLLLLCIFIASNRVFTEGTCKLLNLVISDLVDEDYVIHRRSQAISALMFGTAALVSKPGQTIAPLVGTWLLSWQTGHDVFESGNVLGSIKLTLGDSGDIYRQAVFHLVVIVPIVCAIIQMAAWSQFSLKGKRLQWVKNMRQGAQFATV